MTYKILALTLLLCPCRHLSAQNLPENRRQQSAISLSPKKLVYHSDAAREAFSSHDWEKLKQSIFVLFPLLEEALVRKSPKVLNDYYEAYFLLAVLENNKNGGINFLKKLEQLKGNGSISELQCAITFDREAKKRAKQIEKKLWTIIERYPFRNISALSPMTPSSERTSLSSAINGNVMIDSVQPAAPNQSVLPQKSNNEFKLGHSGR